MIDTQKYQGRMIDAAEFWMQTNSDNTGKFRQGYWSRIRRWGASREQRNCEFDWTNFEGGDGGQTPGVMQKHEAMGLQILSKKMTIHGGDGSATHSCCHNFDVQVRWGSFRMIDSG